MPSYQPVTAALRVLEVLHSLNKLRGASVEDLYKATGLNRSTIIRMLETLQAAGYVHREEGADYQVTGKVLDLSVGYQFPREIATVAWPVIYEMKDRLGWPSEIGLIDGLTVIVIATSDVGGAGGFASSRRLGFRAPILATSFGRAQIAYMPDKLRLPLLAQLAKIPDPWNEPARNPKLAAAMIARIQKQGYATIDDEYCQKEYRGMIGTMGVPIMIDGAPVAGMNIKYLAQAISQKDAIAKLLKPLQQGATAIAAGVVTMRSGLGAQSGENTTRPKQGKQRASR